MRRPGDADGLLLRGEKSRLRHHTSLLAHGSRDVAPRQPATLKVERSLSSSTIFIEHSVNFAAINKMFTSSSCARLDKAVMYEVAAHEST